MHSVFAKSVPNIGEGWIIGQEIEGVLLVGDDGDSKPVVYVPKLEVCCFVQCRTTKTFVEDLWVNRPTTVKKKATTTFLCPRRCCC